MYLYDIFILRYFYIRVLDSRTMFVMCLRKKLTCADVMRVLRHLFINNKKNNMLLTCDICLHENVRNKKSYCVILKRVEFSNEMVLKHTSGD